MINTGPSFFFDTADIDYISKAWKKISHLFPASVIRGVTTNPSALNKVGVNSLEEMKRHLEQLCRLMSKLRPDGKAVVYAQQPNSSMAGDSLRAWAKLLTSLGDGKTAIALKITPYPSALATGRELRDTIEINVTGVTDCATALRAFTYGIRYVSIIPGRMEEIGIDARSHVHFVQQRNPDDGEVIAGSMRTIEGLRWVCQAGTVPTIGTRVWDKIFSEISLEAFPAFWANAGQIPEMEVSPTTSQQQLDLSHKFFEQMDGLGMEVYKEFVSGRPLL